MEKIRPTAWWKGFCSNQELSKIASKILSLPSTTAAVERSFSTYGNIHTAKRNRLSNDTAKKLVFISQNIKYRIEAEAPKKSLPKAITDQASTSRLLHSVSAEEVIEVVSSDSDTDTSSSE